MIRLSLALGLAILLAAPALGAPIVDDALRVTAVGTRPVELALGGRTSAEALLALAYPDPERTARHVSFDPLGDGRFAVSFVVDGIYAFNGATGPVIVRRTTLPDAARITFAPRGDEPVRSLYVAGGFNGWRDKADPMTWNADAALYEVSLPLPPGRYEYKLVLNGRWIANPDEPRSRDDFFGGRNSVLLAGVEEVPPRVVPVSRETAGPERVYRFRAIDGRPVRGLLRADGRLYAGVEEGADLAFRVPASAAGRYLYLTFWDAALTFGPPFLWFEPAPGERDLMAEILYFAMVDRFRDGDPKNNRPVGVNELHPNADWRGGDLAGIRRAVEEGYFTDLGATALWISPVVPQAEGAHRDALPPNRLYTAYHGYWPVALEGVDPRYGSEADLEGLAAAARRRGLRLFCDLVFNHVHEQSPLVKERPDWFSPLDLPDGRRNIRLHDEFPWTTWFDDFLPDFDYGNAAALDYALEKGVAFVRRFGFDGVRLDSVKHLPPGFVRAFRARLGAGIPILGETLADRLFISRYVGSDALDGQFDFPLYHTTIACLARETRDMLYLVEEIERSALEYPAGAVMCNLIGNHDFPRFLAYADGRIPEGADGKELGYTDPPREPGPEAFARMRLAYAFLFTMRGIPLLYYGDEVGMTGAGDPDNRRMFAGVKGMSAEAGRLNATVRALAKLRRARPSLYAGALVPLSLGAEHLAYVKAHFDGERTLVVLSRGLATELHVEIPDWVGASAFTDLMTGKRYKVVGGLLRLPVEPHTFFLLAPEEARAKGKRRRR